MEDLVAVGIADPGHEGLVPQERLQLARVAPDALAPDLQRECRVVGIGTLVGVLEPDDRSPDADH